MSIFYTMAQILRMRAGFKQYEVAMKVGMHPSRLSRIEAGLTAPRESELQALAKLYEISPDLLQGKGELSFEKRDGMKPK